MKSKISKILGIGLSAGFILSLIGAIFTVPVAADLMKWGIVNTPSWEDLVILPASNIIDYDIGGDTGDIIYAVLEVDESCVDVGDAERDFALVKSEDGGVTWTDITDNVIDAANLPSGDFEALVAVAVAPDNEDWLALAGYTTGATYPVWVVASKDGGTNFSYTGDVTDADSGDSIATVYDLAVSPEVDSIHNIAIAGRDLDGDAALFRLKAGTWLSASWDDTTHTDYPGWDFGLPSSYDSEAVIAIAFSPNFDIDDTIVIIIADLDDSTWPVYYLQSGIWESGGSWASQAGFPNAAEIKADGDTLALINSEVYLRCAGLALPADYDGSDPGTRAVFLYVNARLDPDESDIYGGYVFRANNNTLSPVCGPAGDPLLASIDVHGDADTGKLMIGEYIHYDNDINRWLGAECCVGIRVWHTEELDFCCPSWDGACKDPSGPYLALVMYTPDGVKEYASSGGLDQEFFDLSPGGTSWDYVDIDGFDPYTGTPLDESAFSVSRDDAVSFNQIGLIDTDIDILWDVAVCPDCSVIYLATINTEVQSGAFPCGEGFGTGYCDCDSVWRSYDDGDTWERIYHGAWGGYPLLRLPCDAVEDCCDQDPVAPSGTVYLAIQYTNDIFYSRDCGQCWNVPPATKITIQDVAVESENIVYVIDTESNFSKSTQYGRRWSDAVDMGLDSSWTITACCNEGFIVVGPAANDKVAWSDDGGETWNQTDTLPADATSLIQVACDPNCPNIVYAAAYWGGIYRTDLTDGSWTDMDTVATYYTGLAVAHTGGALYASCFYIPIDNDPVPDGDYCLDRRIVDIDDPGGFDTLRSGVARNLTPCETACCGTEDWDYLICGLGDGPTEYFMAMPSALRLCGCLSADTNSILWAIDWISYDVTDGSDGALWSYEDCAAKHGPTLTAPADGSVIDCEACEGCGASPFTLKWERLCLACSYDIQIMDEDGNLIVEWVDKTITGDPPELYVDSGSIYLELETDGTTIYLPTGEGVLECGNTYTWKVREANTSCECVHSPWSETWTFTVAVGSVDAIKLLAPTGGALGVPISNIGFSWSSVPDASSYSFVLSGNAALTGALVSQDLSSTAFNFVGPLDYGKSYYWQIKAWKDSVLLTTSMVGVFSTMAEPEEAPPPVEVTTTPAPTLEIPPAEQITPTWIYAVIAVGAVLVILVIVLIVRSRRP
jgi:hypothetical protein